MNPELVYCRTPEGERLARAPRQIASYAHRATLLLVDGHIDVGELQRRFGESLPIEETLTQLQSDGLIHPKEEPWPPAAEPPATAEPEGLPPFAQDPLFDPAVEIVPDQWSRQEPSPESEPDRREPTLVRAQTWADEHPAQAAASPALPKVEEDQTEPDHPLSPQAEEPDAAEKAETRRRTLRWFGLAVLALGLVAGVTLWLSALRPRVETQAGEALGVQVSVASLGLAIRHGPGLALHGVTIHQEPPLALARVEVMSDPHRGNVWSAVRVIVEDAALKPSELSALAGLLAGNEAVTSVTFSGLSLRLGQMSLGGLAGDLARAADGTVVLKLADAARGLNLEARPKGGELALSLTASPNVLPLLGRPQLGTVELYGLLGDTGFRAGELSMTGYGGKFDGSLAAGWAGPVSVEARLRMAAVSMSQVSRSLFGRGGFSEGQASGTLAVAARAARWDELTRIDQMTANFTVEQGAIRGFDLGAALRERSPRPVSGGETRFESLRGRLDAGPREIRLAVEHLDSGALSASGALTVEGFETLRGQLSAVVQVPGRASLRYPARLGGTVAMPSIQLTLPAGGTAIPDQVGAAEQ